MAVFFTTEKKILLGILVLAVLGSSWYWMYGRKDNIDSSGIGNIIAKKVGGTATVNLPPNTKLVNVSWKTDPKTDKSSLYYLYRPMRPNEFPETYKYQEDSTWGVLESTIIIVESRSEKK